jgi:hypothetical protein
MVVRGRVLLLGAFKSGMERFYYLLVVPYMIAVCYCIGRLAQPAVERKGESPTEYSDSLLY